MKTQRIVEILKSGVVDTDIVVKGWVRTKRGNKNVAFIALNDGSCVANIQVVVDLSKFGEEELKPITTGACIRVDGRLVESLGSGQRVEVQAAKIEVYGTADPETYPLQKKGHTPEFLRSIAHLRPRTNLFGAVFRMRSRLAASIHRFFQSRDFVWVSTPIITASDCEGAGEMFRVTTLDVGDAASRDTARDFFGKAAYLTVSGQLEGEAFACALSNIYTFGPTFRAENSNTTRHAAEFWMVEPEMAFCDLRGDMDMAEAFVRELIRDALENSAEEIEFLNRFVDKGLRERLEHVKDTPFVRCSYTEAVDILLKSGRTFDFPVSWGINLQSEHERFLTEEHFKSPVIVYDYPKEIKPFYMRLNDDGRTVTAMDVLVPGIGEIVGGSQREERLDILLENMKRQGMNEEAYRWYADLRRYGSVPHAGFGAGFERLLMFITGVTNIRDVLPFARTPRNCEF